MDTMKTGAYLAALRKNANMTQQDVADRLGVSNKTISKWESGGGFPDIVILPALAELYGVSADELLERFVQGDNSRKSEGNGLGLSIAKSLTELQNGTMELTTDGDLFKVVLRFQTIS